MTSLIKSDNDLTALFDRVIMILIGDPGTGYAMLALSASLQGKEGAEPSSANTNHGPCCNCANAGSFK